MDKKFDAFLFSEMIKKSLSDNNLTYEEFAERLGKSRSHVAKIATGQKLPSYETFIDICNTLNLSPDYFLGQFIGDSNKDKPEYIAVEKMIGMLNEKELNIIYTLIEAIINNR